MLQISSDDLKRSVTENLDLSRDANRSLLRIEDRIAALQRTQQESINLLRSLSSPANTHGNNANNTDTTFPPYQKSSRSDEGRSTLKQDSMLWLETFVRPTCSPTCRCQCHRSSSVTSPSSLQRIIGAFFLSYNTIPIFSPDIYS